jgi:indole-3-glycerol phosphate synthase
MSGILARILESKRTEIADLRGRRWPDRYAPRQVNLKRTPEAPLRLITEIKFRSPSAGALSTHFGVAARAKAYATAGASMLSVLCDAPFFGGSYHDLEIARNSCDVPLLCKEFIIDESQLDAARAHGADWVLLIARCLSDEQATRLLAAARDRGLGVLFEIHGRQEQALAHTIGAANIGINARDLDSLVMDLPTAQAVLAAVPAHVTAAHLSGLKTAADVEELRHSRADAALVGEILMRQADPTALLREFVAAAQPS